MSDPSRRGLINEAAFIFYCENSGKSRDEVARQHKDLLDQAFSAAASFLRLPSQQASDVESREVLALAGRLQTYFSSARSGQGRTTIGPTFPGCGIIGSCKGDVTKGETLFEVKAGDRNLRSIDFRQLLIYAALRYSDDRYIFPSVGVVNPRTGMSILVSTEIFSKDCSGLYPTELFDRILSSLCANLVSE